MSRTLRNQLWIVAGAAFVMLLILFVPVQRTGGGDDLLDYSCPILTRAVFDDATDGGVPYQMWGTAYNRLPASVQDVEQDANYAITFQWELDNMRGTCVAERDGRIALLVITGFAALIAITMLGQASAREARSAG